MDANYLTIQGWMVSKLELSGNDLLTYALIYGFSQDGETEFTGSINYITRWLNCSRPTAIKALKNLTERGYLLKSVITMNGVSFNRYKVDLGVVKKLTSPSKTDLGGSKETLQGVVKNLNGGSKETLPNNTINTIIDNIDNNRMLEFEQPVKEDSNVDTSNIVFYKDESINLEQVLAYINKKFNKSYKAITKEVKVKYAKLLREGYNKVEVKSAIDNVFNDEFHIKGKYKYATLEYFSRPKTIDMFATMKAEVTANNIEFTLEEKAILCRRYGIRFEYGDTNFIVPPQMTDDEKVAYRKFFDHYKDDKGHMNHELNWIVNTEGIVEYVKNRNI